MRLKREAKEAVSTGVTTDKKFSKLILLVNMARKVNDPQKEQISMLISRFQAHKDQSAFGAALVLKLLSSKDEEFVLDKEQKMLKTFGLIQNRASYPSGQFRHGLRSPVRAMTCFKCSKVGHMYVNKHGDAAHLFEKYLTAEEVFTKKIAYQTCHPFISKIIKSLCRVSYIQEYTRGGYYHEKQWHYRDIILDETRCRNIRLFYSFEGQHLRVSYDCALPPPPPHTRKFNNANI
ncbi:hypothetical protein MAR_035514 [Mya arenaria]|uniref:Uncharacterized protein n=1 Tax=Mya arenaria TaxID=6604 RepID=A0ABY7EKB8_MYAAR|nr:hypothetical protein MAR_035514 [Mya arenaria]